MHTECMHHVPRCSGQTPGGGGVRPGVVWDRPGTKTADRMATPASLSLLLSELVGGRYAARLNEGIGGTRGSATRSQIARSLLISCVLRSCGGYPTETPPQSTNPNSLQARTRVTAVTNTMQPMRLNYLRQSGSMLRYSPRRRPATPLTPITRTPRMSTRNPAAVIMFV